MSATEQEIDRLKGFVGTKEVATDVASTLQANLLRLTFARPEPELKDGDALPPGWHGIYFVPQYGPDGLRPDGTPTKAGVIPASSFPRRMFAGETFTFHRPILLGDKLTKESELSDISLKKGATGTLVFATVVSKIYGSNGLTVEEQRRTAFREAIQPGEKNQVSRREEAPADVAWRQQVVPDNVLLFRYSALTFNSHRIHYDHPWAVNVEGYPDLVVHGPLTSTLLVNFARDNNPGRVFRTYSMQARAPLFLPAPIELRGRPTGGGRGCELWAVTPEGTVAMTAQVEWA